MGNYRNDNRRDSGSRGSFGGNRRSFGGNRGGFGGNRGSRGPMEKHKTVCDGCKKSCEVPFKPTSGKPVYCSDCFEKQGNSRDGNRRSSGDNSGQFKIINEKLDKIMVALKIDQ